MRSYVARSFHFVAFVSTVVIVLASSTQLARGQTSPAWAHVQTAARNSSAGTNALAFGAATTAGDLILVEVDWSDGSSFSAISDSQGHVFTLVGAEQRSVSVGVRSRLYFAANIHGGADTITTVVTGTPAYHELYIHEYAGLDPVAPLDAFSVQVASGQSYTSGTLITTAAHDLLYGVEIDATSASAAPGWTTRSTFDSNVAADTDGATAGTYAFTGSSGGAFIAWAAAFKQAATPRPPDTTAPTAPTGLAAIGISTSQIDLSWAAATDQDDSAAQITYNIFRDGTKIALTAPGISGYHDTGLAAATSYSYTVSANDPAGNTSPQSSPVQGTTAALPVPVISTFTANPASITPGLSATLSWSVSNATSLSLDNGVGDVTGLTSWIVSPAASVTYTLTATNSLGLATAQATILVGPDTEAPSVPTHLNSVVSSSQIDLSWWASTDNLVVAGYKIFRDGVQVGTAATSAYSDTNLTSGALYAYSVSAYDAAGNESAKSGGLSTVTLSLSTAPNYATAFPDAQSPISESNNWINGKAVGLDWSDVATTQGLAFGTQSGNNGFDDSLASLQGNWGADQSAIATIHTDDLQDDSVFEEVEILLRWALSPHIARGYEIAFGMHGTTSYVQIVRWNGAFGDFMVLDSSALQNRLAEGDAIRATVVGQVITAYLNNEPVLQVTDAAFANGNPGLGFYLQAPSDLNDGFGLTSYAATSNSVVNAPSVPTNLVATPISPSEIDLSWSASTGITGPVVGYKVLRNGLEVGNATGTTYSDTGLSASTFYTYSVASYDADGNASSQSTPVTATTKGLAGRSWAHVQTVAGNSGSNANTLSLYSPTQAGNLIVVEVDWSDGSSFSSISDTQGNVYTPVDSEQWSSAVGVRSRLYYAANIRGGANTIKTVVSGSPAYHELYIHEYSGLDPVASLDAVSVQIATGQTFTSGTLTTTAAHDLLYAIEIDSNAATADSTWTMRSAFDSNVAADLDASSPGAYAFTGKSGGGFIAWIVAFRQAP